MARLAKTVLTLLLLSSASAALAWDSTRLSVPVRINDLIVPYPVFSIFVMPDSAIDVGFIDAIGGATISLGGRAYEFGRGDLRASDEPGLEILEIHNVASGEICRINVFTLVSARRIERGGFLNGYRIGEYPREPLQGRGIYRPPEGFVEVTDGIVHTRLSPNFELREFVSKQTSGYTKYMILRPELLLKLENILASLNRAGHATAGFVIMSGYRTPFYNRAIGNVPYSRHVYGGAADIYIDQNPLDGVMDDLNADGRLDRGDARWLADFVDEMSRRGDFGPRIGGLGVYGRTSAHGAFVHVDVRGTRARW
jgi:hypothetical protein